MVGAVAGTPGTPPTNWVTVLNGLTQTVVGAGSSNGINYIDIRFNGTTTSAGFIQIKPDGNAGAISASASQAWAMSSWMAIVGGSTANTTSQQFLLNEYSAGPTYLRTATLASNTLSGGANLTRVSGTITTGASTTIIEPLITLGHNSGAAIDITLRIGLPQLELGSTATAPIPTTNAAVTVFESSWYNQTEGTVFADYNVYAPSGSYSAAEVSDGTSSNRMILFHTAGGSARFLTFASGSAVVTTLDRTAAAASKWTGAYKAGDYGSTYNANAALTNTYNSIITGSQIRIGSSVTGSNFAGTIRRLTYWPSRLPNATLQQITR